MNNSLHELYLINFPKDTVTVFRMSSTLLRDPGMKLNP